MYSIFAGDTCIYNDMSASETLRLINPVLKLEKGKAGSLEMTLPPENVGYSESVIARLKTYISVRKHNKEIWFGRVIGESKDFWNCRRLTCEGAIAFLNDTVQPQWETAEGNDISAPDFFERLIDVHNSKFSMSDPRRFTLGSVHLSSSTTFRRFTNYETTLECINQKLIDELGGYLHVRRLSGVNYIDYHTDETIGTSGQIIRFGTNLTDFTRNWDLGDLATVIIPLGATKEESTFNQIDEYVDVRTATVEGQPYGRIDVSSPDALQTFGKVEKVVKWSDIDDPDELYSKAVAYLRDYQFDKMTLEVTAVDLHMLTQTTDDMSLCDRVKVISPPHGLNRYFPLDRMEIPLDRPENTVYTLNGMTEKKISEEVSSAGSAVDEMKKNPTSTILSRAKKDAATQITTALSGYVTLVRDQSTGHPTALVISSGPDYTLCDNYWMWSEGGLGYLEKDPDTGEWSSSVAMTSDGKIVADMITSGILTITDQMQIKSSGNNPVFCVGSDGHLTLNDSTGKPVLYFDSTKGTFVFEGPLGADAVFTDSLYAEQGNVADLTVNRLDTGDYIKRYFTRDINDLNHIQVLSDSSNLPHIYFVASSVKKSYRGGNGWERLTNTSGELLYWTDELMTTATRESSEYPAYIAVTILTNPYGEPVYWSQDVSEATIIDGYPYINGTRVYTTASNTGHPVMIWDYASQNKADLMFVLNPDSGYYDPQFVLGAGDQNGRNKFRLIKDQNGLKLIYTATTGKEVGLLGTADGFLDPVGLRRITSLDFSNWTSGSFSITSEGGVDMEYDVTFNARGIPTRINGPRGQSVSVLI